MVILDAQGNNAEFSATEFRFAKVPSRFPNELERQQTPPTTPR